MKKRTPKPLPTPVQNALDAYAHRFLMQDKGYGSQPRIAEARWLKAEKALRRFLARQASTLTILI